jgi:hypothetical protein
MNLSYAKWLKLLIKQLPQPRKLYNVDGTENRSGELQFYTDLQVRNGGQNHSLRFFLSDLREHKAILGYPWFAAVQPKIDWKQGWIDHSQLPIVLCSPDAKRAVFVPRTRNVPRPIQQDQYFIGRVTIHPPKQPSLEPIPGVPQEYQWHAKVFSKAASQRLPQFSVWDHAIKLLPGAPSTLPGRLLPLTQEEHEETRKIVKEHLE